MAEQRTGYRVRYQSPTGIKSQSFDTPYPTTALEACLRFETRNQNCQPLTINGTPISSIRAQAAIERRKKGSR